MKPEVKEKWLKALRSGKYDQGMHRLRSKENKFCCLGVLCDLYIQEKNEEWIKVTDNGHFGIKSKHGLEEGILKIEIKEWADIDASHSGRGSGYLIGLNDSGKTFLEIADIIEKEF